MPYQDKVIGILYKTWHAMIDRCHNPKNRYYGFYGGRGILVCERWRNSFRSFCDDMGSRPDGLQLDRVNNDLGYSPENCRWATVSQQQSNKRGWAGRKSFCVNGHHLSDENLKLYTKKNGEKIRACKICSSIHNRQYYQSKKPNAKQRKAAADLASGV